MKCLSFLSIIFLIAIGCTKGPKADSPEGALQKYVSVAFSAKNIEDKKKLLELSTGDAAAYLSAMSDEAFKKQFIDSDLKFVGVKAKDLRQEVSGDVSLVYELSFREGKSPLQTIHTNKKIAYLTPNPETGEWKIKATRNLKSFVERKEDLVITPETTNQEPATEKK